MGFEQKPNTAQIFRLRREPGMKLAWQAGADVACVRPQVDTHRHTHEWQSRRHSERHE